MAPGAAGWSEQPPVPGVSSSWIEAEWIAAAATAASNTGEGGMMVALLKSQQLLARFPQDALPDQFSFLVLIHKSL